METVHNKNQYRILMHLSCKRAMQPYLAKFIEALRKGWSLAETKYEYPSGTDMYVDLEVLLPPEFEVVVELVCTDLNVDKRTVIGNYKIKNRQIVLARECIVGVMRYKYHYPIKAIQRLMKMKNHSLVVHMCKKLCKDKLPDPETSLLFIFYTALKRHHRNYQKLFER